MLVGLVSDAHGNPIGLENCLSDLANRGVARIFHLGDAVGYLPGERRVLELLNAYNVTCLMGNHDAMATRLLPLESRRERIYRLVEARERLGATGLATLAAWPRSWETTLEGRRACLVHGSPWDPLQGYVYPDSDKTRLDGVADVVFMGHTHYPFVELLGHTLAVNVGSCGLPRDEGAVSSMCVYDTETHKAEIHRIPFDKALLLREFSEEAIAPEVRKTLERTRRSEHMGSRA